MHPLARPKSGISHPQSSDSATLDSDSARVQQLHGMQAMLLCGMKTKLTDLNQQQEQLAHLS